MKRILILQIAVFFALVGCGNNSKSVVSKDLVLQENADNEITLSALNQAVILNEDSSARIILDSVSQEDESPDYKITSYPEHGSLSGMPPMMTYIPESNFFGNDSFTYSVQNSKSKDSATVSLIVQNINDAPELKQQHLTLKGESLYINLLTEDRDSSDLRYSIVKDVSHGKLTQIKNNQFLYVVDNNFTGEDRFTYQVSDGDKSKKSTIIIDIKYSNHAPIVTPLMVNTNQGKVVKISLVAKDIDGDGIAYVLAQEPAYGKIIDFDAQKGLVWYQPNKYFSGEDSFSYTATDGTLLATAQKVQLYVKNSNLVPIAEDMTIISFEDSNTTEGFQARDEDLDDLTYSISTNPSHGTVMVNGLSFTYVPDQGYVGDDSFWYVAKDKQSQSQHKKVQIKVLPKIKFTKRATVSNLFKGTVKVSNDGRYAYVESMYVGSTWGNDYFAIVDISDIDNPVVIGKVNRPENASKYTYSNFEVSSDDQYVYMVDYHYGLVVIDISNKNNPKIIATHKSGSEGASNVRFALDEKMIYVSSKYNKKTYGVDISNPKSPVDKFNIEPYFEDLFVFDDGRYLLHQYSGPVKIYDATNTLIHSDITTVRGKIYISKDRKKVYNYLRLSTALTINLEDIEYESKISLIPKDAILFSSDGNPYISEYLGYSMGESNVVVSYNSIITFSKDRKMMFVSDNKGFDIYDVEGL